MIIGKKTIGSVIYMGGVMSLPEPFVWSWSEMLQFNSEFMESPTERINYNRATVSYHSFARNSMVDQIQGDWILMLDTDVTFTPDILMRMLNKLDKFNIDVLVAPYLYKSAPHPPVLYGYNVKTKEKTIMGDWDRSDKVDLIPIRGAGAGCLLIRKRVFDKIKQKLKCSPFDIYTDKNGSPLSEDHSFFERLWQLKIPAYACPDIFVNHLIYRELKVDKDYDPTDKLLKKELPFWKK